MMGDPEYEFFIVDAGYNDHHFIVGEARSIRLLQKGLIAANVRYFGMKDETVYTILPASMVKPKLWIDPFLEKDT